VVGGYAGWLGWINPSLPNEKALFSAIYLLLVRVFVRSFVLQFQLAPALSYRSGRLSRRSLVGHRLTARVVQGKVQCGKVIGRVKRDGQYSKRISSPGAFGVWLMATAELSREGWR
jgi:hypothetical protein